MRTRRKDRGLTGAADGKHPAIGEQDRGPSLKYPGALQRVDRQGQWRHREHPAIHPARGRSAGLLACREPRGLKRSRHGASRTSSSSNGSFLSVAASRRQNFAGSACTHSSLCGSQIAVRFDQLGGGPDGVAPPRRTRPSESTEPLQSPRTKSKLDGLLTLLQWLVRGSNISPVGVSEPAVESSPPITKTRPSR